MKEEIIDEKEFSELLWGLKSVVEEASIIATLSSEETQTTSSPFE
jgi:hypothetical protein